MKVIDLYCGAGGFSLGFKQAGFDIILGVDIWDIALKTYELNIGTEILNKDVRELRKYNLPACDILIGSPPCPDFSIAKFRGSGWGNKQMDLSCINAFYKILNYLKPKYWIWENVLGINKYLFFQPSAILNAQRLWSSSKKKKNICWQLSYAKRK